MKFCTRASRFAPGRKNPRRPRTQARWSVKNAAVAAAELPKWYAKRRSLCARAWRGRNGNDTRAIRGATGAGLTAGACPRVQGSTKRILASPGMRVASCCGRCQRLPHGMSLSQTTSQTGRTWASAMAHPMRVPGRARRSQGARCERSLTRGAGSRSVPPVTRDLRIAIDLRPLALDSVTGVGVVIGQILEALEGEGASFVGVSNRLVPPGRIPATVPVLVKKGPGGRIRWERSVLPRLLRRIDPAPDLFHAPWNHGLPKGLPFPSILTIHDLIPWRFPRDVPWPKPAWLHRALYRRALSSSAREAAAIVTVSETSRYDIEERLPHAAHRVEVVPNPLPHWFRPANEADGLALRARPAGGRPYWLYLGGFDPRKAIPMLLTAVSRAFPDRTSAPMLV